ncbi:MAG: kinase/pyrophosphorylase, partial [Deefgea sp.]
MRRTAFFVSDRTGITAEILGHSLLSQFEDVDFNRITLPFVDTIQKAEEVALHIRRHAVVDGCRPLVFSTIVDPVLRKKILVEDALTIDFLEKFIGPLEEELG